MATEDVYVVTISSLPPVVVGTDQPALLGQVLIDHALANPTQPEFTVNVRTGTREA